MATKTAHRSTSTDLGRLWAEAIRDYNARTGENLSAMRARSVAEVMEQTNAEMEQFKGFRDDGSKKSSFRSAMADHLGDLQTCIDGFAAVGAAAGAFPPAMPVGLVFTAAGRLLSAFAGVRADYDRVEEFFAYSARFFQRLSLLEDRAQPGPLAVAVVRVFSMQLSVCGRVRHLIKEKRFKHWLNALWNEVDEELMTAYAGMQASIQELDEAVNFETYSTVNAVRDEARANRSQLDAVKEDVFANNTKLSKLDEKLEAYRSSLEKDIQQVYASTLNLHVVVTEGFLTMQTQRFEDRALLLQILKNTEKTNRTSENEEKKKQARKPKGDVGDRRFQALRELKKFFAENYDVFPSWQDAHQENLLQDEDMRDSRVKNTAGWLREHPTFKTWKNGENPLLWLRGAEGIGKSFLAYSAVEELRLHQNEHDCIAYFYFKEDHPYQQSMQNAFASAALQIAGSNNRYAEQVAAKIKQKSSGSTEPSTWERFFLSMFSIDNKVGGRLFLVFDGLDEAHVQEGGTFTQFLSDLKHSKASVSVFATSRPEDKPTLQLLEPSILEITTHEIKHDLKMLVKDRLHTLPRVRKFSRKTKTAITRKVVKQADSMLYVEHMLRRFSYIGRERAVSQALENLPPNLHGLYNLLLEECRQHRSEEQYQAMKKLFAWLAFSKRSLSLGEASSLIQLTLSDKTFDIEEEIIGRSSRILELTQARQLEEDTKDEDKDEDENDESKDDGIPEIDYGDSPLSFQDRSLRQYFKSVSVDDDGVTEFRTPAPAAHLTILQMCVEIMMEAAQEPWESTSSGLAIYAISYWYEHLKELDVENATPETVRDVVILLHCITQNTHNVSKLFEKLARHTEIYPERADDVPVPWFDTLIIWAAKASELPNGTLEDKVKEWVLAVNPSNALLPLAQGHIHNWLDSADDYWIPEKFRFVKAALSRANRFVVNEDEPLQYMKAVITEYDIPPEDYKTLRAIGCTLANYSSTTYDPDRSKELITEAGLHLKSAVECMRGDVLEKVETVRLLASVYARSDQEPEAIKYYEKAYNMLPDHTAGESPGEELDKVKMIRVAILIDKAAALSTMKQIEDSLETYNEARKLRGEQPLAGTILDDIMLLFRKDDGVDGAGLMEVLKSWTKEERNSWFTYLFEDWVPENAVARLQRAAKMTGETDLLISWLTALADTLPAQSVHLFNIRGAIAYTYYPILGDIEKGKTLRQEILAMKTKPDPAYEDTMNETKTAHRMQLADILFSEFQTCADPTKKETIMETLALLPSAHDDDDDNKNIRESHVDMLRANMLRIMGPAKEYQKYMNELFTKCIAGLEDGVSWNDLSSLRLLAKVLASLDSLERDARIAISAQFSILDREIHGQDTESEQSETLSDKDGGEGDAEQEPATESEEPTQSEAVTVQDAVKESEQPVESGEIRIDSPTDEARGIDDKAASDEPVEEEQNSTKSEDSESDESESAELDEDTTGVGVFCDGQCGAEINSWTQPFYYCLVCPSCDLCEDCHSKRLKQTAGEIEEPWLSFCGANHRYIKGPMKNWKGIKNGVIRIDDEELTVKEWLQGLKDERWQKAWEGFWTRQGGLKDIGVEG